MKLPGQSHCQCDLHRCTAREVCKGHSMESFQGAHWSGPACEDRMGHQRTVGRASTIKVNGGNSVIY